MTRVSSSAPGKLLISGEYAVLDRAPALVAAVDVRARCELDLQPGQGEWRVQALPVNPRPAICVPNEARLDWQDEEVALMDAAWQALDASRREQLVAMHGDVRIDTGSFFIKEQKLGLGSSAAALTALMGALWRASGGLPENDAAFEALQAAHRSWQGGGSGADLAASLYGGVLLYRREPRIVAPVALPESLQILPVWTGKSASTADFLAAMEEFQSRDAKTFQARMRVLESEAEEAALAASNGDAAALYEALGDFGGALRALGDAAGLPIWSSEHLALRDAVEAVGGVYKPSGAGGGDFGLAFARDTSTLEGVKSSISSAAYAVMPLRFGARGLHVESTHDND